MIKLSKKKAVEICRVQKGMRAGKTTTGQPTWQQVQEAVQARINELDNLIDKHLGTEHTYPLMAGKFELLRLIVSLQDKHR